YVDVAGIRDIITYKGNDEFETTKEGTESYYKLLELLNNVLSDYILTDSDGNEVSTGKKRIYAPNVVAIVDGVAAKLETGISEKQTDGYMELTDEIKEDIYNKLKNILNYVKKGKKTCTTGC
ncbi:MAG: hypothetical protein K2I72_03815, partial [Bacilli bacterium]|nr:hypothetical protein [Bacilli bacterium]